MKRRDLLRNSAALGFAAAAIPFSRSFAAQESTAPSLPITRFDLAGNATSADRASRAQT